MTDSRKALEVSQDELQARGHQILQLCELWMLRKIRNEDFDPQYSVLLTGRSTDWCGDKLPVRLEGSSGNDGEILECEKFFNLAADFATAVSQAICGMEADGFDEATPTVIRMHYFSREWQQLSQGQDLSFPDFSPGIM